MMARDMGKEVQYTHFFPSALRFVRLHMGGGLQLAFLVCSCSCLLPVCCWQLLCMVTQLVSSVLMCNKNNYVCLESIHKLHAHSEPTPFRLLADSLTLVCNDDFAGDLECDEDDEDFAGNLAGDEDDEDSSATEDSSTLVCGANFAGDLAGDEGADAFSAIEEACTGDLSPNRKFFTADSLLAADDACTGDLPPNRKFFTTDLLLAESGVCTDD